MFGENNRVAEVSISGRGCLAPVASVLFSCGTDYRKKGAKGTAAELCCVTTKFVSRFPYKMRLCALLFPVVIYILNYEKGLL